jgi:hypothetical protein
MTGRDSAPISGGVMDWVLLIYPALIAAGVVLSRIQPKG